MLTRDQLDHLCMLTALELPDAEKELLLPQLSAILDLVGELDSCILDGGEADLDIHGSATTALPVDAHRGPELLVNIRHEIVARMPHLKTGLVR